MLTIIHERSTHIWFLPHALRCLVIARVAARRLHQPAVGVALGGPGQVLLGALLRVLQVLVGHPSHVGVTVQ